MANNWKSLRNIEQCYICNNASSNPWFKVLEYKHLNNSYSDATIHIEFQQSYNATAVELISGTLRIGTRRDAATSPITRKDLTIISASVDMSDFLDYMTLVEQEDDIISLWVKPRSQYRAWAFKVTMANDRYNNPIEYKLFNVRLNADGTVAGDTNGTVRLTLDGLNAISTITGQLGHYLKEAVSTQSGSALITANSTGSGYLTVTFPKPFTVAPKVVVTPNTQLSGARFATVTNITATSCDIYIDIEGTGTLTVNWVAKV